MNRKLTAAVLTVLMFACGFAATCSAAMALPLATSFHMEDHAAAKRGATPRQGDFFAPQAYPYAARERLEIYSARPTEDELACVTWGACKPGGRHS